MNWHKFIELFWKLFFQKLDEKLWLFASMSPNRIRTWLIPCKSLWLWELCLKKPRVHLASILEGSLVFFAFVFVDFCGRFFASQGAHKSADQRRIDPIWTNRLLRSFPIQAPFSFADRMENTLAFHHILQSIGLFKRSFTPNSWLTDTKGPPNRQ